MPFILPRLVDLNTLTDGDEPKVCYPVLAVQDPFARSMPKHALPSLKTPTVVLKYDSSDLDVENQTKLGSKTEWHAICEGHARLIFASSMPIDPHTRCDTLHGHSVVGMPHDAHVLHREGQIPNLFIPLLCIADDANIMSLVASIVCQRRLLNLESPVVGFRADAKQYTVQLVLGWSEESAPTDIVSFLASPDQYAQHDAAAGPRCHCADRRIVKFLRGLPPLRL